MQAEHDTCWSGVAADTQALCDTLAKEGAARAMPWTLPCPEVLLRLLFSEMGA